ncbi:kininogen 1 [Tyrophagus putrescentiae]|nr:kininogen 1 [Tyrophagus putrescentiae]
MLAALQAVKDSFEAQLANFRFFTIGPVHSAQSQVVRGTNYYVNFTLTQRNCLEKGGLGGKEGVNCGPSRDLLCEVVIYSPPDHTYELSSIDSVFAQKNTPRPDLDDGGFSDIDVNDPDLVKALKAVKGRFGKKLNSSSVFEVSKVNSAQAQTVAGTNYEVNLTLTQKDCYAKGFGDKSSASCTSKNRLCQAFIWAKLDDTFELTSVDCK